MDIEKLKLIGSEWKTEDGSKHRIYFNRLAELYGLDCNYYGTGNISSAKLNGEEISNSKARKIQNNLDFAKFWYDVPSGEFQSKNLDEKYFEVIVEALKAQAADTEKTEEDDGAEEAPADFELDNKDTDAWTPTQFLEKDPFNSESLSTVVLCVDWENKTATVETRPDNGSYPMREHNGLDSSYTIPNTTDFSQFPAYFSEHIQPALGDMSKNFESHWDGSNWVGRFDFKEAPEDLGTELYLKNEHLDNLLRDAPQTETLAYFDVGDSFQAYSDIISVLENEGIDFMTVDLDDSETVKKIREALEDEVVYIMDDEEFVRDLLRMRESIDEEEEGEEA